MPTLDTQVRLRAFEFLEELRQIHGEGLPRTVLAQGFQFEGNRVPLVGPQGIFKPALLPEIPLSFTTVPIVEGKPRPYNDDVGHDGLIRYRYRGTDPMHRDNVGLRLAIQRRVPLIYFYGVVPGVYMAIWPAYIVGDDSQGLSFSVEVGESRDLLVGDEWSDELPVAQRGYLTVSTQQRLHQHSFRTRVLQAYQESCAVCRLHHKELLDAAHILPDSHPKGEPWVSNGLSLCKLHHAAFDGNIMGIRPDLVIEVREDILEEIDGPMLKHGLQGCHNQPLVVVPTSKKLRPRVEFLEERYEAFRKVG